MCIFGHKFGAVQTDGFQYCAKCGKAKKPTIPHPCVNGHVWVDEYSQQYRSTHTDGWSGAQRVNISIEYFQKCKVCGHKRSIEV